MIVGIVKTWTAFSYQDITMGGANVVEKGMQLTGIG